MKIFYFMALGVFCAASHGVEARAKTAEAALAKVNIDAKVVDTYGNCPKDYYPSKYLDKKHGLHCYKCAAPTTWHGKPEYACK